VIGETGDIDTGVDYHRMAKLSGPRARVRMWFANGTELRLHLDGDRGPGLGAIFTGDDGKIEINRNKLASNPPELVRAPDNPGPNRGPKRRITSRTGSSASRAASAARRTSRSASARRPCATW
jgi:hypothetical protein